MQELIDEGGLRELIVESEDLQSDAMKTMHGGLGDYVEAAKEARFERGEDRPSPLPRIGAMALGAGVLGAGALAFAGSASAANVDVMALQTAASIENLAVAAYGAVLPLAYIGGSSSNPVIKAFVTKTMAQHVDHAKGFNAAATNLGGKAQNSPDPKYLPALTAAGTALKTASPAAGTTAILKLAITLEDVAAQTYTRNVAQVSTGTLRQLFAGVAGVESQHKAILLAVQALVATNNAALIKLPTDLTKLPKAAGSVGFPDSSYPISMASPVTEGAVK